MIYTDEVSVNNLFLNLSTVQAARMWLFRFAPVGDN